jgi:hypothetical protein
MVSGWRLEQKVGRENAKSGECGITDVKTVGRGENGADHAAEGFLLMSTNS